MNDKANRALQGLGVAIIAITLVVAATSFGSATSLPGKEISLGDIYPRASLQEKNDAVITSVASVTKNETSGQPGAIHSVNIVQGAGKPKSVPQPFLPSSLIIHVGDFVKWTNLDSVGHSATSTFFNSGFISPAGGSGNSSNTFTHKFDTSGTYSYFCQIHPWMSGTVYVDVDETQRQVVSTNHLGQQNIIVEMPQNAAFQNKYGPYFIPANAIVASGVKVTWVNHDFIAHTATSSDRSSFDTGPILPSQSKSLIINGTSRIAYFCEIHPWMQASISIINP